MDERASVPGIPGGEPSGEPDVSEDARETALIRKVIRMQERHREGGVDPELDEADADPEPDGTAAPL